MISPLDTRESRDQAFLRVIFGSAQTETTISLNFVGGKDFRACFQPERRKRARGGGGGGGEGGRLGGGGEERERETRNFNTRG